ncbi:MAG: hypothetical protein LBO09_03360 [Candidatus Peribacteria bacterium]|nr:hypothetical protein [Candidatus Peribacteria bacterium]
MEVIGAKTPVLQVVNYSNQAKIVNNYDWEIEVSPLLANDGSPCQIFEGKIETEHNLPFLLQSLMLTVLSAEDNTQSTTFDDLQVHLFLNGVEGTYREAKIEQGKAVFDDLDKIASSGEMVRLFVSTPIGDDIVGEEFFFKISAETETLLGEKGEVAPFITQSFQIKKKRQTVRLSARNIGEGEFTINGEDGETYIHSYESWYLLYYFGEELSFDYIESDDNYQFKSWRVESPDGIYITSSPTLNLTIRDYRGYLFPYAVEAQFEKKAITSSISAVKQESGVKIWGNDGILHMSSQSMQNIQIYSLFGQLVFQDQIEGEWQRSFPKGIYVVKPENQPAQKIKL